MSYTIYILECRNGSYYTGITTDLARRYQEHQLGINCRYTRAFPPQEIAVAWELDHSDKSTAQKIEYFIKQQTRFTKSAFIKNPQELILAIEKSGINTMGPPLSVVILSK